MIKKSCPDKGLAGISAGFDELLAKIGRADSLETVAQHLHAFETYTSYQIIHIGTFRLDDVPVKDLVYTREVDGKGVIPNDFSDEIKWAACIEAEALQRPYDLLAHDFTQFDNSLFSDLRALAKSLGLRQIVMVPVIVRNMSVGVIYNFPDADYETHALESMPQAYRIVTAIFDRFPSLLRWTEEAKLSEREKEVLRHTACGLSEPEIAEVLAISRNTVRNHLTNARHKLDARNKVHAVSIAAREGEIDLSQIETD